MGCDKFCFSICMFFGGFINVIDDDIDWIVDVNGMIFILIGFSGDNISGFGKYFYMEGSSCFEK